MTPEFTKVTIWSPHVRLRVHGNTPNKDSLGGGQLGGVCIGLESDRAGSRTLEKSSRRDRDRVCAKFESSRRFRGSNMNPKKKSRRCRGLGLDSGLDLSSLVSFTALVLEQHINSYFSNLLRDSSVVGFFLNTPCFIL